jgi:hypothetical protein
VRLPPVFSGDRGRLFAIADRLPPLTEGDQAIRGYGDEKVHRESFMLGAEAPGGLERFLAGAFDLVHFTAGRRCGGRRRKCVGIKVMIGGARQSEDHWDWQAKSKAELCSRPRAVTDQAQGQVDIGGVDGIVHRRQQVVPLGRQAATGVELFGSPQTIDQQSFQPAVVLGVPATQVVGLAVIGQSVLAVLADGLQETVASGRVVAMGHLRRSAALVIIRRLCNPMTTRRQAATQWPTKSMGGVMKLQSALMRPMLRPMLGFLVAATVSAGA